MSAPFNVDLAAQLAQTASFQSIVEQTMANNNQLKATAEAAMAANIGQLNTAFQHRMTDIVTHATTNNAKLQAITEALGFGIKSTGSTEEANAAAFTSGGFFS